MSHRPVDEGEHHGSTGVHPQLKLEIMTDTQVTDMHCVRLTVLRETGVRMEDPWALDFLRTHGCMVDEDAMPVRFPGELVEEALRAAPKSYAVRAPNPDNDLDLGGDTLYYSHSSGMQTIDIDTFEPRPATKAEYIDCIRVLARAADA